MLALYVQLVLMALVFAVIGIVQYETRNIFWNPKVRVDNAYAPSGWFYRVNSVFYDPSIYGRFLVVAILASLVVDPAPARRPALGGRRDADDRDHVGGSAAVVLAVELRRAARGRDALRGARSGAGGACRSSRVAAVALVFAGIASPQIRHRIEGKSSSSLSSVTSGRSTLVSKGGKVAVHHPLIGVGVGGFRRAYADLTHLRGKEPKAAASHTTPITVAAETGLPGLILLSCSPAPHSPWRSGGSVRGFDGDARLAFGLALSRDPRALHLLQRALRGPHVLGSARADRGRRARRRAAQEPAAA